MLASINKTASNKNIVKYAIVRVFYEPHFSDLRFGRYTKDKSEKSRLAECLTQCDTARVAALIILFVVLEVSYHWNLSSISLFLIEFILNTWISTFFISAFQEKRLRFRRFRKWRYKICCFCDNERYNDNRDNWM